MSEARILIEGGSYRVVCPCGNQMRFSEHAPERAAAQANRLEEYAKRTGECPHRRALAEVETR